MRKVHLLWLLLQLLHQLFFDPKNEPYALTQALNPQLQFLALLPLLVLLLHLKVVNISAELRQIIDMVEHILPV